VARRRGRGGVTEININLRKFAWYVMGRGLNSHLYAEGRQEEEEEAPTNRI